MKDYIAAFHKPLERRDVIIQIAFDDFNWQASEIASIAFRAHKGAHVVPVFEERSDEICSNESCCSGNEGTQLSRNIGEGSTERISRLPSFSTKL